MRKMLKKWSLALSSCLIAVSAQAAMVDFDTDLDTSMAFLPPLMTHGDMLVQGGANGHWIQTLSLKDTAGFGDLVGAVVDGSDVANTCVEVVCPTNNSSNFLAMLNDAIPVIGKMDGGLMNLRSFDAGFIAFEGTPVAGISMLMRVVGFVGADVAFFQDFLLPGLQGGSLGFNTFDLDAANSQIGVNEVAFFGYACNAQGSCSRTNNSAQFGLDNVNFADGFSEVPEPASMALVMAGLMGLGALRRRNQA